MRISDWSSDVCSSDVRMFSKLVDRIAAVEQHALVAVDIGQLRFAARGRSEAGIVGERAGVAIDFADVDDVGSDAARQDGALRALAPQGDGGGVVGSISSPARKGQG